MLKPKSLKRPGTKSFDGCIFYLVLHVQEELRRQMEVAITELGGRTEAFFSRNITHIVFEKIPHVVQPTENQRPSSRDTISVKTSRKTTTKNPTNDQRLLESAQRWKKIIWDLDKLKQHVGYYSQPINHLKQSPRHLDIANTKKIPSDFQFLDGAYVLLADSSGIHKPVILEEFSSVRTKSATNWPNLYTDTSIGYCPFVYDGRRAQRTALKEPPISISDFESENLGPVHRSLDWASGIKTCGELPSLANIKELKKLLEDPTLLNNVRNRYRLPSKSGWCEICETQFEDLNMHVMTKKHRRIARDPRSWVNADKVISSLCRPSSRLPNPDQDSPSEADSSLDSFRDDTDVTTAKMNDIDCTVEGGDVANDHCDSPAVPGHAIPKLKSYEASAPTPILLKRQKESSLEEECQRQQSISSVLTDSAFDEFKIPQSEKSELEVHVSSAGLVSPQEVKTNTTQPLVKLKMISTSPTKDYPDKKGLTNGETGKENCIVNEHEPEPTHLISKPTEIARPIKKRRGINVMLEHETTEDAYLKECLRSVVEGRRVSTIRYAKFF
ncbi:hypothetical protein BKA69DRAFT_1124887 [Paraphysoderma sedebokerense]|nr:hypothetical protein BKA69DRAFT_1124887 [Paraphysoderma sedebokerense]